MAPEGGYKILYKKNMGQIKTKLYLPAFTSEYFLLVFASKSGYFTAFRDILLVKSMILLVKSTIILLVNACKTELCRFSFY